jgi:hypothetical protein
METKKNRIDQVDDDMRTVVLQSRESPMGTEVVMELGTKVADLGSRDQVLVTRLAIRVMARNRDQEQDLHTEIKNLEHFQVLVPRPAILVMVRSHDILAERGNTIHSNASL